MKFQRISSLWLLLCSITFSVSAQSSKATVGGTIKEASSGETLIGATVQVAELPGTGTMTNEFGRYSLSLPPDTYTLIFSYIGYEPVSRSVNLQEDVTLNISLAEEAQELAEVVVNAEREDANVRSPQAGIEKINMQEINKIPVLLGERDVLKSIQLVPGVNSAGDGNAGFYVRGGAADQNLILLDDALVYNASHLLGFFSTFNSDAIKSATIYKGGMPAGYGGRLSSVLDIRMNDGNNQNFGVSGGIGLISARLNVEGPIQKDKSSFLISGRRTYADLFLGLSGQDNVSNSALYFYDLNAKANYIFSDNDRLYVSGYFGRDKLGYEDQFGLDWGNATGTLRWSHVINNRWFSNTSAIFSDYNYRIDVDFGGEQIGIISRIQDWNLKQEFEYFPNPKNTLKFGIHSTYHTVVPGEIDVSDNSSITPPELQERYSWENALYFSNNWTVSERFSMIYGLRLSSFSVLGEGDFYTLNDENEVVDTTAYGSGEFVKTYLNLEPRLSTAYQLTPRLRSRPPTPAPRRTCT